ncbi:hypothetical protein HC931_24335 [Candidatus Gracilibacteria bacterium]|nr:hypothetical protein [Candidatus Gracilibacteria bacterium]NJM89373.1 hypothetical protein [Hydrococcus sp. RU_2_2]NJP22059.1 hypothetical protein [Hydrococcus sp. CRU_1_1]NJQ97673.1 hypothetical protein [Hydrococcus sp. CSU_1_8]
MKHNKLIAGLVGAIAFVGIGSASFAVAQTFNNAKQSLFLANNEMEFKMNELTPAEEAQQWEEMKQRFIDAGIQLTPQQETTIRQAQRQLASDMQQLFKDNPLIISQLMLASSLPPEQGEEMMKTTGLDRRLGNPLLNYRNSILNALTPEQRPIWEEQIWQRQGEQTQSTENQGQVIAPDPVEQAQQWDATKQRFRDAGIPLTPEQEVQMQAADTKLQAELIQEFQSNPNRAFARYAAFAILPASITERFANYLMGQALVTYLQSIDRILTPEQRQVWEQGFSSRPQNQS